MNKNIKSNNTIYLYIVFAFIISWFFWSLKIAAQQDIIPEFFTYFGELGVFGPFFAFLIMLKIEKKSIKEVIKKLLQKSNNRNLILFVALIPFVLSGLSYLYVVIATNIPFELGLSIQMIVPVAIIILLVGGPIEEFGWRGYLQPLIRSKYSILITGLIIGVIHGLWHLPLHFIDGTVQYEIPIIQFLVITILNAILFSQIYDRTKSLRPLIILHWTSNLSSAIFLYWLSTEGRITLFTLTIVLNIGVYMYFNKNKAIQV